MLLLCLLSSFLAVVSSFTETITCGSVLKLKSQGDSSRLHSHDVKYGSGSGQQSVTGVQTFDDNNSHWQILGAFGETCSRGTPVKCGSLIRLRHLTSGCFLHSHHFQAPLSKSYQEVSCFGGADETDSGDNWEVVCGGSAWEDADAVRLKHKDTGVFLSLSGQKFGRPIHGQREVVGVASSNSLSYWMAAEGVYMDEQSNN